MNNETEKAKIYKASRALQQKIGIGPLDPLAVERAQLAIEENDVDFRPLGLQFLNELQEALHNITPDSIPAEAKKQQQDIIDPVMELKANATIFHYPLIGDLANIMLSFLESIKELDKDAISIAQAHHDTLKAIVVNRMKGDGGKHGQTMKEELKNVCARYYRKKKR